MGLRAVLIVAPSPPLVRRFRHFRSRTAPPCCCEHLALVALLRGDATGTASRLCGLTLALTLSGLGVPGIASSYALILHAVLRLPSREAQQKAFGACGVHASIVLILCVPGLFAYRTHRFGQGVPRPLHTVLSTLCLLVPPPTCSPLICRAKTKQIRTRRWSPAAPSTTHQRPLGSKTGLSGATMSTGGLSPTRPATAAVQAIANQVKSQLESQEDRAFPTFRAVEFRTQVVAGTNFFIKVQYGDGRSDFAHLRVFEALPINGGQVQLQGCQLGHTRTDPIAYF
ncbi:hypothetical protein lerEdw1_012725 [Lerista edwardsae]|nr:hypothetical protein lerEdw1_012725 [Lerista edwardsae]